MAQAARIVVQNVFEAGGALAALDQLVHLFLVLGDGEADAGILQHVLQLLRHRVLIHGHGNPAQDLRRSHGPVQTRTVVADDGKTVAAAKTQFGQAARKGAHLARHLAPVPALPDAEVFFAYRRMLRAHDRMLQQQPRKRIQSPF